MCIVSVAIRDRHASAGDHNLSPHEARMPMMVTSWYSDQHTAKGLFVSAASLIWMHV